MNKNIRETIVTGFAMFAVFFGAGNLIFPPALGLMSGDKWFLGFLGFFLMDVILSIMGVFALIKCDGDMNNVTSPLGNIVSKLILIVVVLCIGPLVAIPRTGAVTFSMGVRPFTRMLTDNDVIPMLIFSVVFFLIVFVLTIKPGKVVDVIGRFLTPILLVCLLVLMVCGVVFATDGTGQALVDLPFKEGTVNGYQTLDGMGAMITASLMIADARRKFTDKNQADSLSKRAGILAGGLLFLVYGGLTLLGALWGDSFAEKYMSGSLDQAGLLNSIVYAVLGKYGIIIIAIVTLFACLTTAIGLTSAAADFFNKLFKNKISYKVLVGIICVLGTALCNVGLEAILNLTSPILTLTYPPIIVVVVLGLFYGKLPGRISYILGVATAFVVSLFNLLSDEVGIAVFDFINKLPLDAWGLNFLVPTIIAVVVGIIIDLITKNRILEN